MAALFCVDASHKIFNTIHLGLYCDKIREKTNTSCNLRITFPRLKTHANPPARHHLYCMVVRPPAFSVTMETDLLLTVQMSLDCVCVLFLLSIQAKFPTFEHATLQIRGDRFRKHATDSQLQGLQV